MKNMGSFFVVLGIAILACGCSNDPPQFRVMNQNQAKANVQVKTTGGNTININDVQPGKATEYQSANEGLIEATASIQGEQVSPSVSFVAESDESYTIVVSNTTPPTLVVMSP
jgi:hypothetical protein